MSIQNMYTIFEWNTQTSKNTYVFSTNDTLFEDYKKTHPDVSRVSMNIFDSDTIKTVLYKITEGLPNVKNQQNIYLWFKYVPTEDELQSFLDNFLNYSPEQLNMIVRMYFGIDYNSFHNNEITFEKMNKFLKNRLMTLSLCFSYKTISSEPVKIFSPNPFDDTIKANFSIKDTGTVLVSNLKKLVGRFHIDKNEIHVFTGKKSLSEKNKQIYFPLTENHFTMNKNYHVTRNQFHDQLTEFRTKYPLTKTTSDEIYVKRLWFRTTTSHQNLTINLKHVFNRMHTTVDHRTMIIFKGKLNTKYKVNRISIGNLKKQTIDKITQVESNTKRLSQSLHVYFSFEKIDARLVLYTNGTYKVMYILKYGVHVQMKDIENTLDEIGSFVKEMNEKGIFELSKKTNIFESPFTEILEYDTKTKVEIADPRLKIDKKVFENNLKQISTIFKLVEEKSNNYVLKFKEVNNFVDIEYSIHKYLLGGNKEFAIRELIEVNGLSRDAAEQKVEEISQRISANMKIFV